MASVMIDFGGIVRGVLARAHVHPSPLAVGFEMTHLCNLECTYCDRHTPMNREMTRTQIFDALEGLRRRGMRHISLDGGEPLAHRHFDEVVAWLVARGIRIYVNTNGILVPRRMAAIRQVRKIKVSLDGPPDRHDAMRGAGSHQKAMAGARAARAAGVAVELTCVVGTHNADAIDELLDLVEAEGFQVIFQPARNSLFLDSPRDGSAFEPDGAQLRAAFARVEARKRSGSGVANRWSSLRHFRRFPDDTAVPCAAGWINVTMDPEGSLFHCGQVARGDRSANVVSLGVDAAFARLRRSGCGQCWCARVVEENLVWGGRLPAMLPLAGTEAAPRPSSGRRRLPLAR